MKNLLFLLLMAFAACDFSYPLKMNEQDSFVVKSDCGNLSIHTAVWGDGRYSPGKKGEVLKLVKE